MKLLAWGVGFGCTLALAHTPNSPATVALIVVLAVCFLVLIAPGKPRPVSPAFEEAQTLSTLDRLDGVGTRTNGESK